MGFGTGLKMCSKSISFTLLPQNLDFDSLCSTPYRYSIPKRILNPESRSRPGPASSKLPLRSSTALQQHDIHVTNDARLTSVSTRGRSFRSRIWPECNPSMQGAGRRARACIFDRASSDALHRTSGQVSDTTH